MNQPLRVVVLGHGVIGSVVAAELAAGAVPGAALGAVVSRSPVADPPAPQLDLTAALGDADLVVECAGQPVVHQFIDQVVGSGVDLLVTSVGACLDPRLAGRLAALGPGRVHATHGAVGGLDLLASARRAAPFERVLMRTTKRPATLVRDWMPADQVRAITGAQRTVQVFAGTPVEAVRLFPDSLNIVAGVALAIGGPQQLTVELCADPDAISSTHRIEAVGPLGEYTFEMRHRPSARNPRSSAITPYSVLHTVAALTASPPPVL